MLAWNPGGSSQHLLTARSDEGGNEVTDLQVPVKPPSLHSGHTAGPCLSFWDDASRGLGLDSPCLERSPHGTYQILLHDDEVNPRGWAPLG